MSIDAKITNKEEFFCVLCERRGDSPPHSSCHVAKKIYEDCKEKKIEMPTTIECSARDKQNNLLYRPLFKPVKKPFVLSEEERAYFNYLNAVERLSRIPPKDLIIKDYFISL